MNEQQSANLRFAEYFRSLRKERRISLRDFSVATGADPGNISKMERGLLQAPKDEAILARYARALNLDEGDEGWQMFFDLAAASTGRVPSDLMEDDAVVAMLPAFFRTIRGQKPTDDDMRRLLDKLKK